MSSQTRRMSLWEAVIDVVGHSPAPPYRVPMSERLEQLMRHHVDEEEQSLEAYRWVRDETGDPVVRMLLGEVLVDEEHHHALLERLKVQFGHELDPATPGAGLEVGEPTANSTADGLAATVLALADRERTGAGKLREIAKQYKDVYSGLFSLILDGLASDSAKHERVLRFAAKRLKVRE